MNHPGTGYSLLRHHFALAFTQLLLEQLRP